MSDLEHARSLLQAAEGDLNALRGMSLASQSASVSYFSDSIFGFHAQQAVEKCLKAWIAYLGERYPYTHDLMALLEVLGRIGVDTSDLEALIELNPFAVQYRYETLGAEDEVLDRLKTLSEVQGLYERVRSHLGVL
jgi:HEPN domain-containing protein